ncbi:beta-1,6-N-acetylglucosaminyltransferase [Jannaschia aquimarina]|uniref:Peptide O-xylosyltransferase n=1 Tax=Jannaschia aquimarina TaxID=935700 RepID=A0A0D1EBI4_9RHOB|nr:beta-1,6-N-acetylglucosaminyltransferase [Jannaschia aquimarina]KIT15104.1 Core-2/I-Branching enzyme [Jannaschia aquimarina]SNS64193.1 Core-2/I-Branching enzyme [Jannaschia aquimarina]
MTLGFVMLVHTAFDRAAQVARYWAARGCPVVIHVDKAVRPKDYKPFAEALRPDPNIRFCKRVSVEWGTWSLVEATQNGAQALLRNYPDVRHVYLASGACLPLRPVEELRAYLDDRPDTDFIESVTTDEVTWTIDGLEMERFTLRFPFSWRKQRRLFDGYVDLQRKLGLGRKVPDGISPHLGSQWWCLTRSTLEAILQAPDREQMDRYFRHVWIPDEAYFQTLARRYSGRIESRSLTLSKFDVQGKPHIFYDDHLQLLQRSDCFVARKIWPRANRLYDTFLGQAPDAAPRKEPNPARIDRLFSRSNLRRAEGRTGLISQGRLPAPHWDGTRTCAAYAVFSGFDDIYGDFDMWLARRIGGRVHGHLFHPARAEFAGGERVANGCISDNATLRDYRPEQFLTNLLWATRGERQSFQFGPGDIQDVRDFLARDPNATIVAVTGAWAVRLFRDQRDFSAIRSEAASLQKTELAFIQNLRATSTKARVTVWSLSEFLENPMERLQHMVELIMGHDPRRLTEVPELPDLTGFGRFLQTLRNEGMKPVTTGDIPPEYGERQ